VRADPPIATDARFRQCPERFRGVARDVPSHRSFRPPSIMTTPESEARKALNRLARALEKSRRELDSLSAAIRHAEGEDFPAGAYREADEGIGRLLEFVEEEGRRLQEKILQSGGLEPGRVRRSSAD